MRYTDGKSFTEDARAADWVAMHWGWACDVLTSTQRAQFERWTLRRTLHHLRLANETL